jgi:hypothetical protein
MVGKVFSGAQLDDVDNMDVQELVDILPIIKNMHLPQYLGRKIVNKVMTISFRNLVHEKKTYSISPPFFTRPHPFHNFPLIPMWTRLSFHYFTLYVSFSFRVSYVISWSWFGAFWVPYFGVSGNCIL